MTLVRQMDCLNGLREMQDDTVDVIVTSPPYWGQRSQVPDGIGTEADPSAYVENLSVRLLEGLRTLKPSGVLFLNIGDSYNTPINWTEDAHIYSTLGKDGKGLPPTNSAYTKKRGRRRAFVRDDVPWARYGNLLGLPYRVAFALMDGGALLRGEIVWRKSRPMPEGRCRRPHRRHELILVFAKDEKHRFRVKPPVGSVWDLCQTPGKTGHDSAFPPDLPRRCFEAAAAQPGDLVVDPFAGSGTTGRVAAEMGLRFVGFDVDPTVCAAATERLR